MSQTRSQYCHHLVSAMEQTLGRPLLPAVREAFLRVPRHVFVSAYYEEGQLNAAPSPTDERAWDAWCHAVYQDEALTTRVDARGLPISSSSQPSVMALMLEQLAIQPGDTLLEIGTGTGYNAALAAVLVGDPALVTTLEIDPELVTLARERIEQVVGPGMHSVVGNGLDGDTLHAPYNRLLATGSAFPIPAAWIAQLKPGGTLLMDLHGGCGGGLLLAHKQGNGHMSGRFLVEAQGISFMRLRPSVEAPAFPTLARGCEPLAVREQVLLAPGHPACDAAWHLSTYERFHEQEDAFHDWLQWSVPGLTPRWKRRGAHLFAEITDTATRTQVTIAPQGREIAITVRGERALWSEIVQAYQDWLHMGKPGKASATWCLDEQGRQGMYIEHHGQTCTLLLPA